MAADDGIAIVVLTHNREHLVSKCVENVLRRTSDATTEIVIWDNASTDETQEYLATVDDPRIRVIRSEENIGQSAYARAFRRDDGAVHDRARRRHHQRARGLGQGDARRLQARCPTSASCPPTSRTTRTTSPRTTGTTRPHEYERTTEHGLNLLRGPVGGGCAMTSRELNQRVGGFDVNKKEVFFLEDAAYIGKLHGIGYTAAVLADLRVHHTGGPYYSSIPKEKEEYWRKYWARKARRTAVKRVLVRVPFVRRLNARYGWFVAPS